MTKKFFTALTMVLFLFSLLEGAEKKAPEPSKAEAKKEEIKKDDKKKADQKKEDENFLGFKKINSYLPENLKKKLKVKLDIRHRFEYQENKFDFSDGNPAGPFDQDGFQMLRTRLTIDYKPIEMVRAFLQLQDSRVWDYQIPILPGLAFYEDSLDIRQAYGDLILKMGKTGSLTFRLGRQELSYGKERLIGGFNWNNTAQTFDGFKAMLKMDKLQVDFFAVRKVIIDNDGWNEWDEHDNFMGFYLQDQLLKNMKLHVYYLFRDTDQNSLTGNSSATPAAKSVNVDESTLGFRIEGKALKKNVLDYEFEFAYQFGRSGTGATRSDIDAYALILGIGYTCPCDRKPHVGIELNYASGDNRTGVGTTVRTFDNLYPTNHLFYGFMDTASLQNLFDVILHFSIKPTPKLLFKVDVHFLSLDTSQDNFYNAGRGARAGTGTGPEYIGTELDLVMKYKVNSFLSFLVGYSRLWTGSYLKAKGTNDDAEFFYFQTALSF